MSSWLNPEGPPEFVTAASAFRLLCHRAPQHQGCGSPLPPLPTAFKTCAVVAGRRLRHLESTVHRLSAELAAAERQQTLLQEGSCPAERTAEESRFREALAICHYAKHDSRQQLATCEASLDKVRQAAGSHGAASCAAQVWLALEPCPAPSGGVLQCVPTLVAGLSVPAHLPAAKTCSALTTACCGCPGALPPAMLQSTRPGPRTAGNWSAAQVTDGTTSGAHYYTSVLTGQHGGPAAHCAASSPLWLCCHSLPSASPHCLPPRRCWLI